MELGVPRPRQVWPQSCQIQGLAPAPGKSRPRFRWPGIPVPLHNARQLLCRLTGGGVVGVCSGSEHKAVDLQHLWTMDKEASYGTLVAPRAPEHNIFCTSYMPFFRRLRNRGVGGRVGRTAPPSHFQGLKHDLGGVCRSERYWGSRTVNCRGERMPLARP